MTPNQSPVKSIKFFDHARARIRECDIRTEEVAAAVQNPAITFTEGDQARAIGIGTFERVGKVSCTRKSIGRLELVTVRAPARLGTRVFLETVY